jgi:hypothetical protein
MTSAFGTQVGRQPTQNGQPARQRLSGSGRSPAAHIEPREAIGQGRRSYREGGAHASLFENHRQRLGDAEVRERTGAMDGEGVLKKLQSVLGEEDRLDEVSRGPGRVQILSAACGQRPRHRRQVAGP